MKSPPPHKEPVVLTGVEDFRRSLSQHRERGKTIGFVPTMGYLHDGHCSLMRAAAAANDVVAISIFVNPLQFGPNEDFTSYPRDLTRDVALAGASGVDLLFAPALEEFYPEGSPLTAVRVSDITQRWEGASRPGHFDGVTTVVTKLFNIVGPCRAYFGEKDYQQLMVVRRMVRDLTFAVEIVGCPTVREPDGLAMSSRNAYLDPEERSAATVLARALRLGQDLYRAGERRSSVVLSRMRTLVADEPRAKLDYAAAVDPDSLEPVEQLTADTRLLVAAWVGDTRLIDNARIGDRLAREDNEETHV